MYSYTIFVLIASLFGASIAQQTADTIPQQEPVNSLCSVTVSLLSKGLAPEEIKNQLISTIHKTKTSYYSYYGDYYEPYSSYGSYGYENYYGNDYYKPSGDYYKPNSDYYKPNSNDYYKPSGDYYKPSGDYYKPSSEYYGGKPSSEYYSGKPSYGSYYNNECYGYSCNKVGETEPKAVEAAAGSNPVKRQAEEAASTPTPPTLGLPGLALQLPSEDSISTIINNLIALFTNASGTRNLDSQSLVDKCSTLPHYAHLSEFLKAFSDLVANDQA